MNPPAEQEIQRGATVDIRRRALFLALRVQSSAVERRREAAEKRSAIMSGQECDAVSAVRFGCHRMVRFARAGGIALVLLAMPACRRPAPSTTINEPSVAAPADAKTEVAAVDEPAPQAPEADPDHWLVVTETAKDSKGGYATGSFMPERNKIVLTTRDVESFTIDTSRISIDWDRLVVISIDGVNSELRKRDYDLLHFARDKYGAWRVVEP
jgi:hypothetical protein